MLRSFEHAVLYGLCLLGWMYMLTELINDYTVFSDMIGAGIAPSTLNWMYMLSLVIFDIFVVLAFPAIMLHIAFDMLQDYKKSNSETHN